MVMTSNIKVKATTKIKTKINWEQIKGSEREKEILRQGNGIESINN